MWRSLRPRNFINAPLEPHCKGTVTLYAFLWSCTELLLLYYRFQAALKTVSGPLDLGIISAPYEPHYKTPKTDSRMRALIMYIHEKRVGGWALSL